MRSLKSSRKRIVIIALVITILAVTVSIPYITHLIGLDTSPQAAQVKVQVAADVEDDPADTTNLEEELPPTPSATETVEVIVTVKEEDDEEQGDGVASPPAWETALSDRQALLELVIVNQGEVPVTPCFVIPAVYDEHGIPLDLQSAGFAPKLVSPTDSTAPDQIPEEGICQTGVMGEPAVYYYKEAGKIPPASALAYTLTLQFLTDSRLPYKGQVNIYIPEAPPPEEGDSKLSVAPYQSLEFTIQEKPYQEYATAWKSLRDWGLPVLTAVLEILAVFLVGALAAYIFPAVTRAYITPSVSLEAVSSSEDDKGGTGEKIKALLQDELDRFRGTRPNQNFSPTLITGSTQNVSLDVSTKLTETAVVKVIVDVLEYVFKRAVIKVTGQIQKSEAKGVGLTLTLTDNRRDQIIDTHTFWELDYSGTAKLVTTSEGKSFDPYLLIVQPAAAWITYKVSENLRKNYEPLGTGSWQSHAYSMSAMHMFGLVGSKKGPDDPKHRALDLYVNALNFDRLNPVANINMARFGAETASLEKNLHSRFLQYDLAQARLRNVVESLEQLVEQKKSASGASGAPELQDIDLWLYKAKYNQALVASLEALTLDESAKKAKKEAVGKIKGEAQGKRTWALNTLKTLEKKLSKPDYRKVEQVRGLLQATRCLNGLIDLDIQNKPNPAFDSQILAGEGNITDINYRVHYDLACYYSLAATSDHIAEEENRDLYYEKGFFHLALGLELPGDLNNFAGVDSDLENLHKENPDRFNAIVNRHAENPVPILGEPGNLDAVLDILSEQADVDTPQELLQAGRTRANRRNLATKSDGKLSYKGITQWVRIADLMRLAGVDELYAMLLYKAGVVSPQVCKEKNATSLHKTLVEFNKKNKIVKRLPSRDQLAKWIRDAKGMEDLVE